MVDKNTVDSLMFVALIMGTPFFVFFGWMSDKVGRKWIMMAGLLVAILSYRPIYEKMYQTVNVKNKTELTEKATAEVSVKQLKGAALDSIFTEKKYFSDGTMKTLTLTKSFVDGAPLVVDGKNKEVKKTVIKNK